MKNLAINFLRNSVQSLLFPPLCLHCQDLISQTGKLLCFPCTELLSFLSPDQRCSTCFTPIENSVCEKCLANYPPCKKMAAAFDYMGPAKTLVHQLKFANRPFLAKDLAAFLIVQFFRLGWPMPDIIIPVPQSFIRTLVRGYNQSLLIAQEVGLLLDRPCENLLKKRSGDFSQMGQDRAQRVALPSNAFARKKNADLADKTVLLIDDVMTTGTTLRHCAATLQESYPVGIYSLTFCQA